MCQQCANISCLLSVFCYFWVEYRYVFFNKFPCNRWNPAWIFFNPEIVRVVGPTAVSSSRFLMWPGCLLLTFLPTQQLFLAEPGQSIYIIYIYINIYISNCITHIHSYILFLNTFCYYCYKINLNKRCQNNWEKNGHIKLAENMWKKHLRWQSQLFIC